jgi:hypothetical protein
MINHVIAKRVEREPGQYTVLQMLHEDMADIISLCVGFSIPAARATPETFVVR